MNKTKKVPTAEEIISRLSDKPNKLPINWEDTNTTDPLYFILRGYIINLEQAKRAKFSVITATKHDLERLHEDCNITVKVNTEKVSFCLVGIEEDMHIPNVKPMFRPIAGVVYRVKNNKLIIPAVITTFVFLNTVLTILVINAVRLHAKVKHPELEAEILSYQCGRFNRNLYLDDKKTINSTYIAEIDSLIRIDVD